MGAFLRQCVFPFNKLPSLLLSAAGWLTIHRQLRGLSTITRRPVSDRPWAEDVTGRDVPPSQNLKTLSSKSSDQAATDRNYKSKT